MNRDLLRAAGVVSLPALAFLVTLGAWAAAIFGICMALVIATPVLIRKWRADA